MFTSTVVFIISLDISSLMKQAHVSAVVLAAGKGSRMQSETQSAAQDKRTTAYQTPTENAQIHQRIPNL